MWDVIIFYFDIDIPEERYFNLKNPVQSVIRALDILEVLNKPPYELGSNETARKIGLPYSTVNRLLLTLESRGYVYQNPRNAKYKLGLKLFDLNCYWVHSLNLVETSRFYMEKLCETTRETISLGILEKTEIVHIARIESPEALKANIQQFRMPATSSAVGKYLLAFLPEEKIDLFLPPIIPKRTPNTITSLTKLKENFKKIRLQNYALDDEEGFEGVRCIATGISDQEGNKIAGVGIIAPSSRFPDSKIPMYRDLLFEVANNISSKTIKHF